MTCRTWCDWSADALDRLVGHAGVARHMISNQEIAHVRTLKRWAGEAREGIVAARAGPMGAVLKKLEGLTESSAELVVDNVDYLVAIIEREYTAQRVKHLARLGDR
jgi:hypothetical protein